MCCSHSNWCWLCVAAAPLQDSLLPVAAASALISSSTPGSTAAAAAGGHCCRSCAATNQFKGEWQRCTCCMVLPRYGSVLAAVLASNCGWPSYSYIAPHSSLNSSCICAKLLAYSAVVTVACQRTNCCYAPFAHEAAAGTPAQLCGCRLRCSACWRSCPLHT